MLRQSLKSYALSELHQALCALILCNLTLGRKPIGKTEHSILLLILAIQGRRYLAARTSRPRPFSKFRLDLSHRPLGNAHQPWLNDLEFLTNYRMQRKAFWRVVELISDDPIFKRGSRGPSQEPVAHQLMVFLNYIGTAGSGASGARSRNLFHVGYGSTRLYIKRVRIAIRDQMRKAFYNWPDENERVSVASAIKEEFGIPNCLGVMDGTTFETTYEPQREDSPDFQGRKPGYTLTVLFVGDNKRRIRYYNSGWVGSAHDNRIGQFRCTNRQSLCILTRVG